jgi:SDR family mycofactocin-dependent oxidoreductase
MGRVEGKVALVTGAARGQGRSHAVRLAEEGADIIAVDVADQIDEAPYPLPTPEDLAETVNLVEKHGRRIVARQADVRDFAALDAAVADGVSELGPVGIVVANAGISQRGIPVWEMSEEQWRAVIDINLTGVWHTVKAALPSMIEAGQGGAVVLTASSTSIKARAGLGAYVTAKHGLTGLMRTMAVELAAHRIRVNTVNPTSVPTGMLLSDRVFQLFRPDLENPTVDDAMDGFRSLNALPVPWVEPVDISNAVVWLASDEARYVTGIVLPVDAGSVII